MAEQNEGVARHAARAIRSVVFGLALLSLAACVERIRAHGYVPDEEQLSQITVGVDTRDTVSDVLGAPSTSGLIDDSGYYYIRSSFRHFEREVVAVTFDSGGVVQNIERFSLQDGRTVVLSRRVTDIDGRNNGLLRNLLRNLGRFDPASVLN